MAQWVEMFSNQTFLLHKRPTALILLKKDQAKGGFKSEDTGEFFHCQHKYSKSLSWAENLNFPPKTLNNLFKFSAQDSDLEYSLLAMEKFSSIF